VIRDIERHIDSVLVQWEQGASSSFPFIWLKDIDPLGFHPQTQERLFDLTKIDLNIQPSNISFNEQGLILQWPDIEDESFYACSLLKQYSTQCQLVDSAEVAYKSWHDSFSITKFTVSSMSDAAALKAMLKKLKQDGIVIVSELVGEFDGGNFGDNIGFKRETNFGVMFEVFNKPDPNNLAYTDVELPLHTDLANQELPPGYQFLHCIKNDAQGGESVLADGFAIAEDLREQEPAFYEVLSTRKMGFRFHDKNYDIRYCHTLIKEESGVIKEFIFNAHLAQTVSFEDDRAFEYYRAYQHLMTRIRQQKYAISFKLKAGEMMIFDNRRVLHGRKGFDATSGERHLRGYYIDRTEVDSCLRKL